MYRKLRINNSYCKWVESAMQVAASGKITASVLCVCVCAMYVCVQV